MLKVTNRASGRLVLRTVKVVLSSPHTCEGIQGNLGYKIPLRGIWIPGTGFRVLCQWNVDSRLQSLVGFRIAN